MNDDIPPFDPALEEIGYAQSYARELEFAQMEAESEHRMLAIREIRQRQRIKTQATVVAVVVLIFMACVLGHLVHSSFWGPFRLVNSAFSVAMIVAPIASITAITVALFVGAFRKYDEGDVELLGTGITTAANSAQNS